MKLPGNIISVLNIQKLVVYINKIKLLLHLCSKISLQRHKRVSLIYNFIGLYYLILPLLLSSIDQLIHISIAQYNL